MHVNRWVISERRRCDASFSSEGTREKGETTHTSHLRFHLEFYAWHHLCQILCIFKQYFTNVLFIYILHCKILIYFCPYLSCDSVSLQAKYFSYHELQWDNDSFSFVHTALSLSLFRHTHPLFCIILLKQLKWFILVFLQPESLGNIKTPIFASLILEKHSCLPDTVCFCLLIHCIAYAPLSFGFWWQLLIHIQTGFSMEDILRKYIRYALNEKTFNPELVVNLIQLRKASTLEDSQVAEILNEISRRIVREKGNSCSSTGASWKFFKIAEVWWLEICSSIIAVRLPQVSLGQESFRVSSTNEISFLCTILLYLLLEWILSHIHIFHEEPCLISHPLCWRAYTHACTLT